MGLASRRRTVQTPGRVGWAAIGAEGDDFRARFWAGELPGGKQLLFSVDYAISIPVPGENLPTRSFGASMPKPASVRSAGERPGRLSSRHRSAVSCDGTAGRPDSGSTSGWSAVSLVLQRGQGVDAPRRAGRGATRPPPRCPREGRPPEES